MANILFGGEVDFQVTVSQTVTSLHTAVDRNVTVSQPAKSLDVLSINDPTYKPLPQDKIGILQKWPRGDW